MLNYSVAELRFISNVAINSQISPFYGGVWLSLILKISKIIFVFHLYRKFIFVISAIKMGLILYICE